MKIETADLYHKVAALIAKKEKTTLVSAQAILDDHETYFVDMVEAFGEEDVEVLADTIITIHYDEINN